MAERLGNRRKTGKEQFFTPRDTALEVLDLVLTEARPSLESTFLEPAAGTGAFLEAARARGFSRVLAYDIEPRHPDVQTADFLTRRPELSDAVVVTNPPFGRNNALSVPFFNHAADFASLIAFIVPLSWRKWSVQNRLDPRFWLVHDQELKVNYVDEDGEANHGMDRLRTCIQVWRREEGKPRPHITVKDMGLIRRASPAEADIALSIFGFSCGQVEREFERVKNTTKVFLKLNHPDVLEALETVDFSRFYMNTAYTEALAWPEINYLLNEKIYGDPMLLERAR